MSDFGIFFIGCFVSLIVLAAVGLLLWGAANEPRGTLFPRRWQTSRPRQVAKTKSATTTHVPGNPERIAG